MAKDRTFEILSYDNIHEKVRIRVHANGKSMVGSFPLERLESHVESVMVALEMEKLESEIDFKESVGKSFEVTQLSSLGKRPEVKEIKE